MKTSEFSQWTKLLSESSPSQKESLLAELARQRIEGDPDATWIPIRDADGTLLACLMPFRAAEAPTGDEFSPAFAAALRRRIEDEPSLTPEQFASILKALN